MNYYTEETIDKIRRGYYSAVYFNRTKEILESEKNHKTVVMQVFQKNEGSILCGVGEVVELFRQGAGLWVGNNWESKFDELTIEMLKDGDKMSSWETAMHIKGPYVYFAHLESLYLGILARRTMVATNTRKSVDAAHGKPVIFFADRFDHFLNQEGDGYAATIGGAAGVSTQAHTAWIKGDPKGTIPHALIAINEGDTIAATDQFAKHIKDVPVIALVDFDNDCVKTALNVAQKFDKKLWGVRLDTTENLVDTSLSKEIKNDAVAGVNPTLVRLVRKSLDDHGFSHVKIVVSGGFDYQKISTFEKEHTPVDVYGVGSLLIHGHNDFTADIVEVSGEKIAKVGRIYKENLKLQKNS